MNGRNNCLQFNKKKIRRHSDDMPINEATIVNTIKG